MDGETSEESKVSILQPQESINFGFSPWESAIRITEASMFICSEAGKFQEEEEENEGQGYVRREYGSSDYGSRRERWSEEKEEEEEETRSRSGQFIIDIIFRHYSCQESTETEDEPVMKKKLKKSTVVDSVSISQSQTTVVKKKKKKKFNQVIV